MLDTDAHNLATASRRDGLEHLGCQRHQLRQAIRDRVHHNDCNSRRGNMLLIRKIPITCYQRRKTTGSHKCEEIAVALTGPVLITSRRHVDADQSGTKSTRHTFVEQYLRHAAARANNNCFANSSTAIACSRVTIGKSRRNSSSGSPASRYSTNVCTGTRVPTNTGVPPIISGSLCIGSESVRMGVSSGFPKNTPTQAWCV